MQGLNETTDLIANSAVEFWQAVGAFLPALLGAVLLIILGALVAKAAQMIVVKTLEVLGVNKLKKNKKVSKTLKETGLEVDVVDLSGRVAFWVVIIVFAMAAVEVLGLNAMREVIHELVRYLPNVLAAVVVLTITIAGARLLKDAVTATLKQMSVGYAAMVGTVAQWAVVVFGAVMTVDQLGFNTTIITANITVIVAGVVLALALAFGLGGRDHAARILDNLSNKTKK